MPIYEYRCPKCTSKEDRILPVGERNDSQICSCGETMKRLMSVPLPAIFLTTRTQTLVDTLNDDGERTDNLPGKPKNRERYKQVIGSSLFSQEKPVIGRGFGG